MKASTTSGCIPSPQRLRPLLILGLAPALVAVPGIGQGRAAAESPALLTNMAISVMPEYHEPRVLVSYRGELNTDVSLPLQVRLRLPADASVEHTCSVTPPDEHTCQPYTAEPDGQYLTLTYETTTPILYVEIYYGSISGIGQRSLDFTFWPPYPVQNLDLIVQEPSEATDFTLSPAPAAFVEDPGFRHHIRHHTYSFQDLPTDDPLTIQMTYTRPTDQPSAPLRAATAANDSGGISQGIIVFLGLASAAVLGFVLYSVLARRLRIRLVAFPQEAPGQQGPVPQAATFFCRHCGGRVKQGFAFCPRCRQEARLSPKEQQ